MMGPLGALLGQSFDVSGPCARELFEKDGYLGSLEFPPFLVCIHLKNDLVPFMVVLQLFQDGLEDPPGTFS